MRKRPVVLVLSVLLCLACDTGVPPDPLAPYTALRSSTGEQMASPELVSPPDVNLGEGDALLETNEAINRLDEGACLLEYAQPNGRYLRIRRKIVGQPLPPPAPFSIAYRVRDGSVSYRATCNVSLEDRADVLTQISWAPGRGPHSTGMGWRHGIVFGSDFQWHRKVRGELTLTRSTWNMGSDDVQGVAPDPMSLPRPMKVNLDAYSQYDWCYVLMQGDEIVDVLYCGYNSDPDACDPTMEECASTGGGGTSDGGTGDDGTEDPTLEDPCKDWFLVSGASTCEAMDGAEVTGIMNFFNSPSFRAAELNCSKFRPPDMVTRKGAEELVF